MSIKIPLSCPHCKTDLRDRQLPKWVQFQFNDSEYTSKAIAVWDSKINEIEDYICPICGKFISEPVINEEIKNKSNTNTDAKNIKEGEKIIDQGESKNSKK